MDKRKGLIQAAANNRAGIRIHCSRGNRRHGHPLHAAGKSHKDACGRRGVTENLDQGAKEVSFTNNGEADVFLRVAFAQSWVAQDGTVLPNHITDASGQSLPAAVPSLSLDGSWESGRMDGITTKSASRFRIRHPDRSTEKLVRAWIYRTVRDRGSAVSKCGVSIPFTLEIVQSSDAWNVSRKGCAAAFDRDISVTPDSWDGDKYGCSINWNADSGKN
ncbi:MAG: hypothetical protein ACLR0U_21220 [Enterocloster clostridioformis]